MNHERSTEIDTGRSVSLAGPVSACWLLAVLLCASLPCNAIGQLPVSRQAAVLPTPVAGGATTAIGVPFAQEPALRDVVSSVGGQTITGSGIYPVGGFAATHYVLIVSGPQRGTGLPITANTTSTVTVTGIIPSLVAGSDEFEIVPFQTLASLFGDPPTNLAGGSNAGSADKVVIEGVRYFFKTTAGWRLETAPFGADMANAVIANLSGVSIIRLGAATTVNVRGIIRSTRAVIPIATGTSLASWPYPGAVTLSSSGLQSTLTGAASAGAADKVVLNGVRYFYKTSAPAGWRLETAPFGADQSAIPLNPSNRAFNIIRLGTATGLPVLETFVP